MVYYSPTEDRSHRTRRSFSRWSSHTASVAFRAYTKKNQLGAPKNGLTFAYLSYCSSFSFRRLYEVFVWKRCFFFPTVLFDCFFCSFTSITGMRSSYYEKRRGLIVFFVFSQCRLGYRRLADLSCVPTEDHTYIRARWRLEDGVSRFFSFFFLQPSGVLVKVKFKLLLWTGVIVRSVFSKLRCLLGLKRRQKATGAPVRCCHFYW